MARYVLSSRNIDGNANIVVVTHVMARALEAHANHINQRAEASVISS
jgi:hypothetical protein